MPELHRRLNLGSSLPSSSSSVGNLQADPDLPPRALSSFLPSSFSHLSLLSLFSVHRSTPAPWTPSSPPATGSSSCTCWTRIRSPGPRSRTSPPQASSLLCFSSSPEQQQRIPQATPSPEPRLRPANHRQRTQQELMFPRPIRATGRLRPVPEVAGRSPAGPTESRHGLELCSVAGEYPPIFSAGPCVAGRRDDLPFSASHPREPCRSRPPASPWTWCCFCSCSSVTSRRRSSSSSGLARSAGPVRLNAQPSTAPPQPGSLAPGPPASQAGLPPPPHRRPSGPR